MYNVACLTHFTLYNVHFTLYIVHFSCTPIIKQNSNKI